MTSSVVILFPVKWLGSQILKARLILLTSNRKCLPVSFPLVFPNIPGAYSLRRVMRDFSQETITTSSLPHVLGEAAMQFLGKTCMIIMYYNFGITQYRQLLQYWKISFYCAFGTHSFQHACHLTYIFSCKYIL